MKILAVIIDGCNPEYITSEGTPFLDKIMNEGASCILTASPSFENRREIISGRYPETTDTFVDFCFDPNTSPFRFFRFAMGGGVRIAQRSELLRSAYVRWARLTTGTGVDFVNIPNALLPYFSKNTSASMLRAHERRRDDNQLFGLLEQSGIATRFLYGTVERIETALKGEKMQEQELLVLHYGETDKLGHTYGPHSIEVQDALRRISSSLQRIAERERPDYIVVTSDHNMVAVTQEVDLFSLLTTLDARPIDDYFVFLNSPLARFWFRNEQARNEVRSFLSALPCGNIVTKEEMNKEHLPVGEKYGELIFWLKKGWHIRPDFYRAEPTRGMHGYLDDARSVPFIVYGGGEAVSLRTQGSLVDIAPSLLDIMGVPATGMDGTSLFSD